MKHRMLLISCVFTMVIGMSGCRKQAQDTPLIAATNSLLECAARDLLDESTPILRLTEPGMCPGHFDIRPSQVEQLRRCRVLLRLDFQKSLDTKLSGVKDDGLRIAEIHISGGLCEPSSYLAACRQIADALVAAELLDRSTAERRLDEIDLRIRRASSRQRRQAEALRGMPVVANIHQAAFCRWLGLNVVATFSGADTAGTSQVNRTICDGEQAGAKLIIANFPEGRRLADALAERLGAEVVVFDNFPTLNNGQSSFDDLLEANVNAIVEAATK